jgi:hypothetical protein
MDSYVRRRRTEMPSSSASLAVSVNAQLQRSARRCPGWADGVSVDQPVHRVWVDRVPRRTDKALYSYLSRLRQVLAAGPDLGLFADRRVFC